MADRVFVLPPGVDFPAELARGLVARYAGGDPADFARVEVWLNSRLLQQRLREALAANGARLLPRMRLLGDPADALPGADLPRAVSDLRRRLELMQLVARLIAAAPDLAPRTAVWALTEGLAELLTEMQVEGVGMERLDRLDTSDLSAHWDRSLQFLRLVGRFLGGDVPPDAGALQALVADRLAARWTADPPPHPVVLAGSTGSRGTTLRLMEAVARLPGGALVLPGFDTDLPDAVWEAMGDALAGEDHPQYRLRNLLRRLGARPGALARWTDAQPAAPRRNALVSLALRPAPVTDQWLTEGPALGDPGAACEGLALVEAQTPRAEALAVALALRQAAAADRRAVLVTPDRHLARQVVAALDRWGLVPDDSAGRPLAQSAPGRLLRQIAALDGRPLTVLGLLALLKHPLVHSGVDRGPHLLRVRDLELHLRRRGPAFPSPGWLRAWAAARGAADAAWGEWLADCLARGDGGERSLALHVARLRETAETLAAGPGGAPAALWDRETGAAALELVASLAAEAEHGGSMAAEDFAALLEGLMAGKAVRPAHAGDPRIAIRGPIEARALQADVVVLAGLNDGVWPQLPPPDPWLNRRMRHAAGLTVPERRIGLSAHDFQMAIAAPEVVLCRSVRDGEAETVPSRWLNRLIGLLDGLGAPGRAALAQMRERGAALLAGVAAMERPGPPVPTAPRPAPAPPVAVRPRELAVTTVVRLIRDPYAVYARHVLGLRALPSTVPEPDAALRGEIVHDIVRRFFGQPVRDVPTLLRIAAEVLESDVPWPAMRALWLGRLARVAGPFVARDARRTGTPVLIETPGAVTLPRTGIRITARPDRVDMGADGRVEIFDYKTGQLPSRPQIEHFEKQLPIEAMMAARGGFAFGPAEPSGITLVGLGSSYDERSIAMTPADTDRTLAELETLLAAYLRRGQGYASRRAVRSVRDAGDYDHLARFGEWDGHDRPQVLPVGPEEEA